MNGLPVDSVLHDVVDCAIMMVVEETMTESPITEAARTLAAQRQPKERRCAICGTTFVTRGRGVYCGTTCQQRAYRARKQAKEQS